MKSTTQNAHRIHWKFSEKSAEAAREKSPPRMLLNAEKCSQIHEWSKPGRRWIYRPLEGAVTETANCCCKKKSVFQRFTVEAEGFRGEPMLPGRGKLGTGQKRESIREREGAVLHALLCCLHALHFITLLNSATLLSHINSLDCLSSPLLSSPLPCQLSHERPTACHCRWAHALRAVKSFLPLIKGRSAVMQLVKQY